MDQSLPSLSYTGRRGISPPFPKPKSGSELSLVPVSPVPDGTVELFQMDLPEGTEGTIMVFSNGVLMARGTDILIEGNSIIFLRTAGDLIPAPHRPQSADGLIVYISVPPERDEQREA